MTEQLKIKTEQSEALLPAGEVEKLLEATTEHSAAELAAEAVSNQAQQKATAESARATVEDIEQTNALDTLQASEAAAADHAPVAPPNNFLKQQSAKQAVKRVQDKESATTRALSKVVHQPAIRATSEIAAKTITRPSGLLGGGLAALVGGSAYLYLAYHIGFVYRPTVFLALSLVGFIVGVAIELLIRLVVRPAN